MQKQVMILDNFEKDVLHTTIFRLYDKRKFPTAKKLALGLRD
jgi:hypothetical protein